MQHCHRRMLVPSDHLDEVGMQQACSRDVIDNETSQLAKPASAHTAVLRRLRFIMAAA